MVNEKKDNTELETASVKTVDTRTTSLVSPDASTPQSVHTTWRRAFFSLLIAVVVLLSAGIGGATVWLLNENKGSSSLINGTDGNQTITQEESDIAAVAAKVSPSVVSITSSIQTRSFYGTTSSKGSGTGIIISTNGYVMTNYHVIEDASDLTIIDSEGNEYDDVKVIGKDPLNDVAFLKINDSGTKFPAVEIGDSSTVRIGQQVVAIGNALGQYQNSVTSGILSGTGRPVTAASSNGNTESLVDLLQTDASINPGNSGGPLLNLAGQVIGINTAIADDANGIGFAIPINSEKGVMKGVLEDGKVERSYLGVNYLSITGDIAREYDLSVKEGAYIYIEKGSPIVNNSPGDKAGLKKGDIIQKVNDYTVGDEGGLSSILGQYRPGDKVTLSVLREDKTITLDVTLGAYPTNN